MSILIDDDFEVVRRARRHHRAAVVVIISGVCAIAVGIGAAIATGSGWPLIVSGVGVLYAADGRTAERPTRHTRRLPTTATAELDIDDFGLTIRHPTLPEPLRLSWPSLRACAVEAPAVKRRWRPLHYDLFPIERSPDTVHPLYEPRWFLSTHDHGLDKHPVPLTTIDLAGRIPNVALLFGERLSVAIAAPPMGTGFGWIPPGAAQGAARSLAMLTLPLAREVRTISTPGVYLRVQDHIRLINALDDAGVRRAFTCEDWSFATGSPHRSQPSGRAPTASA